MTVDVQIKENKSTTDRYVTQYIDLCTSARFGRVNLPAHFFSEVDYTVSNFMKFWLPLK